MIKIENNTGYTYRNIVFSFVIEHPTQRVNARYVRYDTNSRDKTEKRITHGSKNFDGEPQSIQGAFHPDAKISNNETVILKGLVGANRADDDALQICQRKIEVPVTLRREKISQIPSNFSLMFYDSDSDSDDDKEFKEKLIESKIFELVIPDIVLTINGESGQDMSLQFITQPE